MKRFSGVALLALPTLLVGAAHAATPVSAPATTPAPGSANAIIPLPLQPTVPAEQRSCAAKTASGLGYTMLRAATGPRPGPTDYVLVNYIGYLAANGQVFDQGQQSPLQVSGVISGFAEGLQMIGKGGIYRLCIPAAQGYGARATGPIPANSDLAFQIEVVDSKTVAEVEALRAAAQKAEAEQAPAQPAPAGQPAPATQPKSKP